MSNYVYTYVATVEWDNDGEEEGSSLPSTVALRCKAPLEEDWVLDYLSDILSDKYGFRIKNLVITTADFCEVKA